VCCSRSANCACRSKSNSQGAKTPRVEGGPQVHRHLCALHHWRDIPPHISVDRKSKLVYGEDEQKWSQTENSFPQSGKI
jgi:hypothetical protein